MNLYKKVRIKNFFKRFLERKYRISFKNLFNKRRYYIIRRKTPWAGFFANYLFVACQIKYAIEHNYIPVIDMKNYPTLYSEEKGYEGIENSWEYFFEQPKGNSLEAAYKSRNYIISDTSNYLDYLPYYEGDNMFEIDYQKILDFNFEIISKIPIRKEIENKLNDDFNAIIGNSVVLGVHVRGTDKRKVVNDHHVSPSTIKFLDEVIEMTRKYKIDKILLCCDEVDTISVFKNKFGEKLVLTNAYRAKSGDCTGIHLEKNTIRENHKYLLGYEVLRDCYFLSKCNYLIYGHSNVTNTAIIWNQMKYVDSKFIENDIYIK